MLTIAYVLGSRFPTEKAYGVTCLKTVEQIHKAGSKAHIFAFQSNYTSKTAINCAVIHEFKESTFSQFLRKFGSSGNTRLNQASWKVSLLLTINRNIDSVLGVGPDYIWLRDPVIAARILKKYEKIIILELHTSLSKKNARILKKYKKRKIFSPISKQIMTTMQQFFRIPHIVYSPMSIDPRYLATRSEVNSNIDHFFGTWKKNSRIGYVGKFSPNGYSKGIEDLIALGKLFADLESDASVAIVGGSITEVKLLQEFRGQLGLTKKNLRILPHVEHGEALKLMSEFDVLVFPAPRNSKYDGMPIKALEYLATGRHVVMADTSNHGQIFDASFQPN